MKLITQQQSQAICTTNPRSVEVKEAFGTQKQVAVMLSPQNFRNFPCNYSVALMLGTYGRETLADIIRLHVANAILTLGNDRADPAMALTVAEAIVDCPERHVRLLTMTNLLHFFTALMQGTLNVYGVTHLSIMQAFQQYANDAFNRQQLLEEQRRSDERERAYEQHSRTAVTWQQYAASKGLEPDTNPLDYVRNQQKGV